MKICKRQYRIVTDKFAGYEVQKRLWYYPFWFQIKGCNGSMINTSENIQQAEELIEIDKKKRKIIKTYPCD